MPRQGGSKGGGVGRIQTERRGELSHKTPGQRGKKVCLVHAGSADIHVKHLCPCLNLLPGILQGKFKASRLKFRAESLFACGIDPFANQGHRHLRSNTHKGGA